MLSLSVCVPVYKGSKTLSRALNSIFRQNYLGQFEVIILDDNKPEDFLEIQKTKEIINSYKTEKIQYFKNQKNLGSALTIKKLAGLASGDILTFLCQDDIFSKNALQKIVFGFTDNDVGVLTRPFYWFVDDFHVPVRQVEAYSGSRDSVISIFDNDAAVKKIFNSVGQISGLAYRKKYLSRDFTSDVFPGHIYPFAEILKKYKCMFLKDYIVAVSLTTSQTRHNSKIYFTSPLEAWIKMFNDVFDQKDYEKIKKNGIKNIATHYEGLIQIRNYGSFKFLLREVFVYLKSYPKSALLPKFWFFVLLTVFFPKRFLIFLSDFYKMKILSRGLRKIDFVY